MIPSTSAHPAQSDVFGAYSLWPRRHPFTGQRLFVMAAALGTAALVVHCVLPLIARV